jgi:hypothetical protein
MKSSIRNAKKRKENKRKEVFVELKRLYVCKMIYVLDLFGV